MLAFTRKRRAVMVAATLAVRVRGMQQFFGQLDPGRRRLGKLQAAEARAAAGFPVTVTTAGGKVHLASRPDAIISLSPPDRRPPRWRTASRAPSGTAK